MTPADLIVGLACTILATGFNALWRHSAANRDAIARIELDVARNYVTASQMQALRGELHEVRAELRRVSDILVRLETLIEPPHGRD